MGALVLLLAVASCPPEGAGGDRMLNVVKNRTDVPEKYETLALADVIALDVPAGATKRARRRWPQEAILTIQKQEQRAVSVDGYIVGVKVSEPESCNCHDERDIHILIGSSPSASHGETLIVEMTPRL